MIWFLFILITLLALGPIAWLAMRPRPLGVDITSLEVDVETYKDQLTEIGRDLERGVLSAEAADRSRAEISRKLIRSSELLDAEIAKRASAVADRNQTGPLILIGAVVPLLAFSVYALTGSPYRSDQPFASRTPPVSERIMRMVEALETERARMMSVGASQSEWAGLGAAYLVAQRFERAAESYEQALQQGPATAELYASRGGALVLAKGGQVDGDAEAVFDQALALDGSHGIANYFKGVARYQQADYAAAKKLIEKSVASEPEAAEPVPWYDSAQKILADIETKIRAEDKP